MILFYFSHFSLRKVLLVLSWRFRARVVELETARAAQSCIFFMAWPRQLCSRATSTTAGENNKSNDNPTSRVVVFAFSTSFILKSYELLISWVLLFDVSAVWNENKIFRKNITEL